MEQDRSLGGSSASGLKKHTVHQFGNAKEARAVVGKFPAGVPKHLEALYGLRPD